MAQWVKVLAVRLDAEFDPENPRGRKRELTAASCPLTSTCTICMYGNARTRTHRHNKQTNKGFWRIYFKNKIINSG